MWAIQAFKEDPKHPREQAWVLTELGQKLEMVNIEEDVVIAITPSENMTMDKVLRALDALHGFLCESHSLIQRGIEPL